MEIHSRAQHTSLLWQGHTQRERERGRWRERKRERETESERRKRDLVNEMKL